MSMSYGVAAALLIRLDSLGRAESVQALAAEFALDPAEVRSHLEQLAFEGYVQLSRDSAGAIADAKTADAPSPEPL